MAKLNIQLDDDILARYEDELITTVGRVMLIEAQNLRILRSQAVRVEQLLAQQAQIAAKVVSILERLDAFFEGSRAARLEVTVGPGEPK